MANHWLVKSEPEAYSWDDLLKLGRDHWDGVRNYQARNNLREMRPGDEVLFYHSGKAKEVVGVCRVVSPPYQDPTTDDARWVVVDVEPVARLKQPVSLAAIKADVALQDMGLVKQSRLSVVAVKPEEFDRVIYMGEGLEE